MSLSKMLGIILVVALLAGVTLLLSQSIGLLQAVIGVGVTIGFVLLVILAGFLLSGWWDW